MLSENQRRRIARKFLEENFGKKWKALPDETLDECRKLLIPKIGVERFNGLLGLYNHNFELWPAWIGRKPGDDEQRAFQVLYPPYLSDAKHQYIVVSDSKEELNEIVPLVFDEERRKLGLLEHETYGKYYIVYD